MLKFLIPQTLLLVILAFIAGFFLHPNSTTTGTQRGIITIADDGFQPKTMTIAQGEYVTFKNLGEQNHWPASNIHPSHGLYPEFDPKRGLAPKESWDFTFEKPGEWRYHDHLFEEMQGIITVIDAAEEKSAFQSLKIISIEDIEESTPGANELLNTLRENGVQETITELVQKSGSGSIYDCHQQAHDIGRVGYVLEKEKIFQSCDASCHSGCYHGAMEIFLKDKGTTNLAVNIDAICNTFATHFGIFECLHGVGHGLLAYLDYDLPLAIDACDWLSNQFERRSCYGGVFMENILTAQGFGARERNHTTKWANSNDPHLPCNTLKQNSDLQYECYLMQTSWMLTMFDYDFAHVAAECLNTPAHFVSVCFRSYGRDAAGHTLRDPKKILELCEKIPKGNDYFDQCVNGAVNVIVDFFGPTLEGQASELCHILDESSKLPCYGTIAGRLPQLFSATEKIHIICETFEDAYQYLCKS